MSKKKPRKTDKNSVTAKGSAREIELNIVTWLDLMAYGGQIAQANFDPSHDTARQSLERLRKFQEILNKHAARNFNILSLNDGAVISRDFSPRAISVTFDFIKRSIDLYLDVFESDKKLGNIGPRGVIACGFRTRSKFPSPIANSKLQKILKKLAQKEIPAKQAVIEATTAQPYFGTAPQLHANFAFSKAYIIDDAGKAYGFSGPNLYIERCIFEDKIPNWLEYDAVVSTQGIGPDPLPFIADFLQFKSLDVKLAGRDQYQGIRGALQICEKLSNGSAQRIIDSRIRESPRRFR